MKLDALPATLRAAMSERKVYDSTGALVDLHSNVSPEEAMHLYLAVRDLRPEVSLEVGFAQGVSAQAILQALEDNVQGHHHIMDPFQSGYGYSGVTMVQRANLAHRMTFHEKFAEEIIPTLPEIGFAFIDASHLFDLTISEFVLVDKRLKIGGVVGFHDMWMPAQQAFIRYVLGNRAYRVYEAPGLPPAEEDGTRRSMAKKLIRRFAATLPRAERVFAPDFLKPWEDFQLGNLVLLQKTGTDNRDWKFHQRF